MILIQNIHKRYKLGEVQIPVLKGISINIWNEKSRDAVVRKYKTTGRFSPKNKDSICVFKFNKNAGLTRYTPSNTDDFHYDFYKSDQFDLEMIIVEEVMILKN